MSEKIDFTKITHADWESAYNAGMEHATTFRAQSNLVIMGAVGLFWAHSKNIAYVNKGLAYAAAYRGLRVEAVKGFFRHFTGAVFDKGKGEFVKGGKAKAIPAEFADLENWVDWADREKPEPKFDASKDANGLVKSIERKLCNAQDALVALESDAELEDSEVDPLDVEMLQRHVERTKSLLDNARTLYN